MPQSSAELLISSADISIKNGTIHTCSIGSGEQTLVMIHGGPDWDCSYLQEAAEMIARQANSRVLLFDIRGCGRSSRFDDLSEYTVAHIIGDILAILDAYQLKSCHLLGFSFGGIVALNLLKQHPEVVDKLILASTCAYPAADFQPQLEADPLYQARHTPQVRALISHAFTQAEPDGPEPSRSLALGSLTLDIFDLSKMPAASETIKQIRFSSEWIKAFRTGQVKTAPLDIGQLFGSNRTPLLILHGEHDLRFPVSVAHRLHQQVAGSELTVIKQAGHLTQLEQPQPWAAAITGFISEKSG